MRLPPESPVIAIQIGLRLSIKGTARFFAKLAFQESDIVLQAVTDVRALPVSAYLSLGPQSSRKKRTI